MLMSLFGCRHAVSELVVEREATVEQIDADFDRVTYHLICQSCSKPVKITHAATRGGVTAFLRRPAHASAREYTFGMGSDSEVLRG